MANFGSSKQKDMTNQQRQRTGILDSEGFTNRNRQYYFDIKLPRDQQYYLRITRRDQVKDETYERREIIFFEEDISFMVEAITMLLGRYSAGQLGISA